MTRTIAAFDFTDPVSVVEDISLDPRGNLAIADGVEDVRQRALNRLRFWLGEWYMDQTKGVRYIEQVFGRQVEPALAASAITGKLREVEGVIAVYGVRVEIDPMTRRLSYSARLRTDSGEVEVNGGT